MKRNQTGGALVAVLATVGILIAIGALVAWVFIGASNTANALEVRLKTMRENNKNVLASYSQKLLEAAQVPTMMRDDVLKVTTAAIEGRYGKDGSKAVFQAIQEQNPNLDSKVYIQLQQIIEAGRDEFKTKQTEMLGVKQTYETALGSIPQGMLMRFMGYPKVDMSQFQPVTTDGVENTFKAGKESSPIQLRPKDQ